MLNQVKEEQNGSCTDTIVYIFHPYSAPQVR